MVYNEHTAGLAIDFVAELIVNRKAKLYLYSPDGSFPW